MGIVETPGVLWDIQIVINFFIVAKLKLNVDGAIRCGAGQIGRAHV